MLYQQLDNYLQNKFSELLCGFRKRHSTQHVILNLLQYWQENLDKGNTVGTILMDLSKAYDTLHHGLLLAKLHAYGFDKQSLTFLYSYLSCRKQRVRIGGSYSDWLQSSMGVPQGSILGPILFNIFINDLFLVVKETNICNFADDNTIYHADINQEIVKEKLSVDVHKILEWFSVNSLVANPGKFQVMFLGRNLSKENHFFIDNKKVSVSSSVTLLGVIIDDKLTFKDHVDKICNFANFKTYALRRIRNYIEVDASLILYSSYIYSNFLYCPLVYMFSSKRNLTKIHNCQKRALRAVYNNYEDDFESLLELSGSTLIHTVHLRFLMSEIFKSLNSLNPNFMNKLFVEKNSIYQVRRGSQLNIPTARTNKFGSNSVFFRGSILWNSLPTFLKTAPYLKIASKNGKETIVRAEFALRNNLLLSFMLGL